MRVVGRGEDLIITGNDLTIVRDGASSTYKNAYNGSIRGSKLEVDELNAECQGILRGYSRSVCSHNKIYLYGKAKMYMSAFTHSLRSPLYIGSGYNRNDLVLTGIFNSIKILSSHYDLQGIFGKIEVQGNIHFYGNCDEATAYNAVYLLESPRLAKTF